MRFPSHLEREYAARLLRRLDVARRLVLEQVLPLVPEPEPDPVTRTDDVTAWSAGGALRATLGAVARAFRVSVPLLEDSLLPTAQAVDTWSTAQSVKAVEQIVKVDLEGDTRLLPTREEQAAQHVAWARENVGLITTMEASTFDDLAQHVSRAVVEGRTAVELEGVIRDRFGVAEGRARLIARDQIAKLNGRITQARQEAMGVPAYEWSSSGDERVRPIHRKLDGTIRRWDNPHPTEGHPGSAIACRCVAIPVIDEAEIPTEDPETQPFALPTFALPPFPAPALPPAPPAPWLPPLPAPKFAPKPSQPLPAPGGLYQPLPPAPPPWIPLPGLPTFTPKPFQPTPSPGGLYAPLVPPVPPPPAPLTASDILAEQLSGPAGSNPGGVYRGTDGVERYVKFYTDPAQAHGEALANELYRELGIDAPASLTFRAPDGRTAFASEIVADTTTLGKAGITKARAAKFLDGFAADVLLGNWDVVGLSTDNLLVGKRGRLLRVDNGAALLMRAKAGRKPTELLGRITEWSAFFDPHKNPAYAKVAAAAGVHRAEDVPKVATQIRRIVALQKRLGGWGAFVEQTAPALPASDRAAVVQMLESRTELLSAQLKAMDAEARRAKKLGPELQSLLARDYREMDAYQGREAGKAMELARTPLTPSERSTLHAYTDNAYDRINPELRAGGTPPETREIDRAIAKGKTTEDVVVHRGVKRHDFFAKLDRGESVAGNIVEERAYVSTSLNRDKAFDGRYRLRIRVPKGSEALWVGDLSAHSEELEAILPRGTRLYVVDATKTSNGEWKVECLLLPK